MERGVTQDGRDALVRRETWEDCVNNRHINKAIWITLITATIKDRWSCSIWQKEGWRKRAKWGRRLSEGELCDSLDRKPVFFFKKKHSLLLLFLHCWANLSEWGKMIKILEKLCPLPLIKSCIYLLEKDPTRKCTKSSLHGWVWILAVKELARQGNYCPFKVTVKWKLKCL